MSRVRCAIYTRKSSEEGLEQGFNSLDAQREACAAYVLSQAGQGWEGVDETYDDGGLSGGTLERPALQRLLGDVKAGRIDIIVVYKVDRLTRSLLDFATLVAAFDQSNVSFVSITQSFNTTTSMGRLTLNMLLSFAQFEREVTAERIRDKIAASKAKGMWMGGTPPLGYRPEGRSLAVIEEHADLVQDIHRRYLELGNVRLVAESLQRDGIRTPVRTVAKSGKTFGGCQFSKGQLYAILRNPVYVGDIGHRGTIYPGQHQPILDREDWVRVQQLLAGNANNRPARNSPTRSVLAGKIVDDRGEPLVATHATKGNKRYRYYVSRDVHHGTSTGAGLRIPAREIEGLVAEQVARLFDDPVGLAANAQLVLSAELMTGIDAGAAMVAAEFRAGQYEHLDGLVVQVRIEDGRVVINASAEAIASTLRTRLLPEALATVTLTADVRLTRTGRVVRLVQKDGRAFVASAADPSQLKLLATAHRCWSILKQGELTVGLLAAQEGVTSSWMTRVLRLAFLSPKLTEAILSGTLPTNVNGLALVKTDGLPSRWDDQHDRFLAG